MENQNEQTQVTMEKEDVILPDGWTGEGDFFEWAGGGSKDDDLSALVEEPTKGETEEADPTLVMGEGESETAESKAEEGDQPATQDKPEEPTKTIRFEANINHRKKSVEIDPSELPELYEKAYAVDKFRNKLNARTAEQQEAEVVSQLLGYSSVKDMLVAARKSFEDTEVERLISEKVHPDIAKDTVARKIKEVEEKAMKNMKPVKEEEVEEKPDEPAKAGERDFKPEVAALLQAYPELHGKVLPQEVVDEALKGSNLTVAYTRYVQRQTKAENERLQKENKTLKQNAEAAKRAPVRGVAKGGATNVGAEDPFLSGFNYKSSY